MKNLITYSEFLNEGSLEFPTNLKLNKVNDVVNGDQVELIDSTGKRFGSTTENEDHDVFWTNGKINREILKKIGEKQFIQLLKKHYKMIVKEVM